MSLELGIQLWGVKDFMAKNFYGTIKSVSDMGYSCVELATYREDSEAIAFDAKDMKRIFDDLGLKCVSSHTFPGTLKDLMENSQKLLDLSSFNWDKMIEDACIMGMDCVTLAGNFYTNPKEDIPRVIDVLNTVGEKAKEKGLFIQYHNHYMEFEEYEGKYIYDYMIEETNPDYVKFEVDTYWTIRAGQDPLKILDRLKGRIDVIHQKDLPGDWPQKNALEILGGKGGTIIDLLTKVEVPGSFIELGKGCIDIESIMKKAYETGVKYVLVEQSFASPGLDDLTSHCINYNYLKDILDKIK